MLNQICPETKEKCTAHQLQCNTTCYLQSQKFTVDHLKEALISTIENPQPKQEVDKVEGHEQSILDSVEHLINEAANNTYTGVESNPRDTLDKRRKKEEFISICNIGVLIGYKLAKQNNQSTK